MKINEMPLIIAVDPGGNGSVSCALFNPKDGTLGSIRSVNMPKEIKDLNEYIGHLMSTNDKIICFIEQIQIFHSDRDKNPGMMFRMQKLHNNVAQIKAVFSIRGIKLFEVAPVHWQKGLGLRSKEPETTTVRKNNYKAFAQGLFPSIKVDLKKGDSLCILEYARRKCMFDAKKYLS